MVLQGLYLFSFAQSVSQPQMGSSKSTHHLIACSAGELALSAGQEDGSVLYEV